MASVSRLCRGHCSSPLRRNSIPPREGNKSSIHDPLVLSYPSRQPWGEPCSRSFFLSTQSLRTGMTLSRSIQSIRRSRPAKRRGPTLSAATKTTWKGGIRSSSKSLPNAKLIRQRAGLKPGRENPDATQSTKATGRAECGHWLRLCWHEAGRRCRTALMVLAELPLDGSSTAKPTG